MNRFEIQGASFGEDLNWDFFNPSSEIQKMDALLKKRQWISLVDLASFCVLEEKNRQTMEWAYGYWVLALWESFQREELEDLCLHLLKREPWLSLSSYAMAQMLMQKEFKVLRVWSFLPDSYLSFLVKSIFLEKEIPPSFLMLRDILRPQRGLFEMAKEEVFA